MKFLIQTIDGEIKHEFSWHLIKALEFHAWQSRNIDYIVAEFENIEFFKRNNIVPIGSVEFVSEFLRLHYGKVPKPKNVPNELFDYAGRKIWRGYRKNITQSKEQPLFIKSNTKLKADSNGVNDGYEALLIEEDEYQISEIVDFNSEWRAFVFKNELVGLQNYLEDFTLFPDIKTIHDMIESYKKNAPVAYTLDVGIMKDKTVVVEVHDFFSVGLYGFSNYKILPFMFSQWFYEFIK